MNVAKLRGSTAVDKALSMISSTASKPHFQEGVDTLIDKSTKELSPKAELTVSGVSTYLQNVSAISCGEIEALIRDLSGLREKLVADGGRIERDVVDFAALNQSVVRLTEVVMDSVTHVQASGMGDSGQGG